MTSVDGSRPSILCVANFSPDVGFAWNLMEGFWVQLAEMGRAKGYNPIVVYPEDGELPERMRTAGFQVEIQPFPGTTPGQIAASLRFAHKRRVRLVYFTDRPFTRLAYLLLRLVGVRTLVNNDQSPGDRPPSTGLKGFLKYLWRRVPGMSLNVQTTPSPLIRERAIQSARAPAGRVVVVQNGIDPIECEGASDYARREFNLPEDAVICITVGRAHHNKRIEFVIEAARRVVGRTGPDHLYFVHCGDGPLMDELLGLAETAELGERFVFAGRRDDVPDLLCSSDFAIHAAKAEAFSFAIIEYMSAGLPVVVPDVPTVCQAIEHGRTGLVYRDGDADEAAGFLSELAREPQRRARLGAAAARQMRENYTAEKMKNEFVSQVGELL